jgi:ABC-type transporter Mla subunit MlaD
VLCPCLIQALSHQVQSVAQSLAVKASATCTAAVGEAAASVQGALSGLAELEAEWAAAQSGVDGLLQGLSAEVADMRAAIAELRPQLASEMADVQGALSSTLANVQASYQVASQGLAAKTEQLLSLDAQLSSLGPEGLDGMCRELHQVRTNGTHVYCGMTCPG